MCDNLTTNRARLLILNRLLKWGIGTDGLCRLCGTNLENHDHISLMYEWTLKLYTTFF